MYRSALATIVRRTALHEILVIVLQLPALVIVTLQQTPAPQAAVYGDGDVHEFCQMETFSPRCRQGDVIVMTTARFGRMRVGKCIRVDSQSTLQLMTDSNSLGCYADVLDYADKICSGRVACDIQVPNRELLATRPCNEQLTTYLEASYTCLPVVEEDRSCKISVYDTFRLNIRPPIGHQQTHYAVRDDDQQHQQPGDGQPSRCGSPLRPWVLEAPPGQQINIRLLDFVQQRRGRRSRWSFDDYAADGGQLEQSRYGVGGTGPRLPYDDDDCDVQYGYIVDKAAAVAARTANKAICASDAVTQRDRFVYRSEGRSVEIVLVDSESRGDNDRFTYLISFEAVGCGNLMPPPGAWLRRVNNVAVVGCFLTRRRWHLQCVDGTWRGIIGTCIEEPPARSSEVIEAFQENRMKFQVVALVTIGLFATVSCVAIVIVGIVCFRSHMGQDGGTVDTGEGLIPRQSAVQQRAPFDTLRYDDQECVYPADL